MRAIGCIEDANVTCIVVVSFFTLGAVDNVTSFTTPVEKVSLNWKRY